MSEAVGTDKWGASEKLSSATKVLYGVADLGAAMVTSSVNFSCSFSTPTCCTSTRAWRAWRC